MNTSNSYAASALAALLLLAGCGDAGQVKTSVVAASDAPLSDGKILTPAVSRDGGATLNLPEGASESAAPPAVEGAAAEDIVLFRQYTDSDTTVYLTKTDTATAAADYFSRLENLLKTAAPDNLHLQAAANNRMAYRFSRTDNGDTWNESCVVLHGGTVIYTACAASPLASAEELDKLLADTDLRLSAK